MSMHRPGIPAEGFAGRTPTALACELCQGAGGEILWRDERLRVVMIDDPEYPGFLRVVWDAHVREMSDLDANARACLMNAVVTVELAVRQVLVPDKINLASLGNVVAHLHWHVIHRYARDAHFPQPIWGARQRDPDAAAVAQRRARLPQLRELVQRSLGVAAMPNVEKKL